MENDFYNALFENEHAVMLVIDPENGEIVDANKAACYFYGWSVAELRSMKIWQISRFPVGESLRRLSLASQKVNNFFSAEHRLSTGELRQVEIISGPVFFDSKQLLFSIVNDVTAHKKAEYEAKRYADFEHTILALSKSFINQPLDELKNSIEYAMGLVGSFCNAEHVAIYRYDYQERQAIHLYEWSATEHCVADKLKTIPFKELSAVLSKHEAGELYQRSRVEELSEDTHFSRTVIQFQDNSVLSYPLMLRGGPVGALTLVSSQKEYVWPERTVPMIQIFAEMLTALYQREQRERALQEANRMNRFILDSSSDGIMLFSREGTILNINQTFMDRYSTSLDNAIGRNFLEFLPAEKYGDLGIRRLRQYQSVFDSGIANSFVDSREGIWFMNRVHPVVKDGKTIAVTLFSIDITAQKNAEEEAIRNDLLKVEAKELRIKEAELLQIIDGSTEGTYIADYECKNLVLSFEWAVQLGMEHYSPHKLYKIAIEKNIILDPISDGSKEKVEHEFSIPDKNGKTICVLRRGKRVFDANGNVVKEYGSFTDVTERREMNESLRKSEMFLRLASESAELGTYYVNFETNEEYWSPQLIRLWGLKPVREDLRRYNHLKILHRDDRRKFRDATAAACAPNSDGKLDLDLRIMRPDGEIRWLQVHGQTEFIGEGKNRRAIWAAGAAVDITNRKTAEDAFKQNESLLRGIIEGSTDAIFLKDKDGKMILVNAATAQIFGIPTAEIIGKTNVEFFQDSEKGFAIMEAEKQIMSWGEPAVVEEFIPSHYGTRIHLTTKVPWMDANGKIIGLIGISRDITERKKKEEELQRIVGELAQKNKLITDFFTNVSHEFKTPLSLILIQLELMELEQLDKTKLKKLIAVTRQNSFRLTRLVENLLDITKIEAGYMKTVLVNADIVALIHELCESVKDYAAVKSIELTVKSSLRELILPIDMDKTERIVLNLLSNAIKFTEKGHIAVAIKNGKDGGARIVVEDDGIGIPKEKQKVIFDRFAQVDHSFNRQYEGCGIGLSLVKLLVEMLQGTITLKSKKGEGSRFVVDLPKLPMLPQQRSYEIEGYDRKRKVEIQMADLCLLQR